MEGAEQGVASWLCRDEWIGLGLFERVLTTEYPSLGVDNFRGRSEGGGTAVEGWERKSGMEE